MKIGLILFILVGCFSARGQSPLANQAFGVFDFDLRGATPGEQIDRLTTIGFDGLAMNLSKSHDLARWQGYQLERPGTKLLCGFLTAWLDNPNEINNDHWSQVLQTLSDEGALFWCIFRKGNAVDRSGLQSLVDAVAVRAGEFGLDLNIYPHDGEALFAIQSLEEAMGYVRASSQTNIKVSAHLCHEIRAGNGDRLEEVLRAAGDKLALVSINGANQAFVDNSSDWSDSIQPLSEGDFDSRLFVEALDRVGYRGPVILHTFGLASKPASHYQSSYDLWRSWVESPRATMSVYSRDDFGLMFGYSGLLETSTDLETWTLLDPQPSSPVWVEVEGGSGFYRAR